MSRPAVTYPRADTAVIAVLTAAFAGQQVTVGSKLPPAWTPTTAHPHIQVLVDGTPRMLHPVAIAPTVRIVAWAVSPTLAWSWAMKAHGVTLAHQGPTFSASELTGPFPAVDPDHANAELCSVTVRVRVRSVDI